MERRENAVTTFESMAEIDPIVSSTNWIKRLKQYFKFNMVQFVFCILSFSLFSLSRPQK